jgi:hypothetical protein
MRLLFVKDVGSTVSTDYLTPDLDADPRGFDRDSGPSYRSQDASPIRVSARPRSFHQQ